MPLQRYQLIIETIFLSKKNKLKQFRVLINYSRLSVVSREITHDGFRIEEKTYF